MKYRLKTDPSVTCEVEPKPDNKPGRPWFTVSFNDQQLHGFKFDVPKGFLDAAWEEATEEPGLIEDRLDALADALDDRPWDFTSGNEAAHKHRLAAAEIRQLRKDRDQLKSEIDEWTESYRKLSEERAELLEERDASAAARKAIAEVLEPGHDLMVSEIIERIRRLKQDNGLLSVRLSEAVAVNQNAPKVMETAVRYKGCKVFLQEATHKDIVQHFENAVSKWRQFQSDQAIFPAIQPLEEPPVVDRGAAIFYCELNRVAHLLEKMALDSTSNASRPQATFADIGRLAKEGEAYRIAAKALRNTVLAAQQSTPSP